MRPYFCALLLLVACREPGRNVPVTADAGPRSAAKPVELGPPPAPPALRQDKGDCSARYASRPDRDRFPMCRIPAGTFMMGYQPGEPAARRFPARKVTVRAFLLDQVEVTAAQYVHFLQSLGPERFTDERLRHGWWGRSIVQRGYSYHLVEAQALHPINTVDWEAARRYCDWAGKRLPTSAEWELAARFEPTTKRALRFPWGDRFDPQRNGCDERARPSTFPHYGVTDVGTFDGIRHADGRSPSGVHDLFGNADEWVADEQGSRSHTRRGCAHYCDRPSVAWWSHDSGPYAGFRCAADLTP